MNQKVLPMKKEKKYKICMISDFFYPEFGGVESHIYNLALCLIKRGHKVVVITKSMNNRSGIRYMSSLGLKVYYLPLFWLQVSSGKTTFPFLLTNFNIYRSIFIREEIEIVHGHQTSSVMASEGVMTGAIMGLKTVFTDHSLFGFGDSGSIHLNMVIKFIFASLDHIIAVSNIGKQNIILRTDIPKEKWNKISVLPNAVDTQAFRPSEIPKEKSNTITIVVVTRLVYRKGVTLLKDVIPKICSLFSNVNFIIGGAGELKYLLEQVVENNNLFERVKLLGPIPSHKVRDVLIQGDIFLNCSLTEAFGISIIEAASCGLLIVSTKVGGIPEVLPDDMMNLAEPNVQDIIHVLSRVIKNFHSSNIDPFSFHSRVEKMYNWNKIGLRTEKIYEKVYQLKNPKIIDRLYSVNQCGLFYGKLLCCLLALYYVYLFILNWLKPKSEYDIAINLKKDFS